MVSGLLRCLLHPRGGRGFPFRGEKAKSAAITKVDPQARDFWAAIVRRLTNCRQLDPGTAHQKAALPVHIRFGVMPSGFNLIDPEFFRFSGISASPFSPTARKKRTVHHNNNLVSYHIWHVEGPAPHPPTKLRGPVNVLNKRISSASPEVQELLNHAGFPHRGQTPPGPCSTGGVKELFISCYVGWRWQGLVPLSETEYRPTSPPGQLATSRPCRPRQGNGYGASPLGAGLRTTHAPVIAGKLMISFCLGVLGGVPFSSRRPA